MLEEATKKDVTDDDTQDIAVPASSALTVVPQAGSPRQVNVNPTSYAIWPLERVHKDAFWCWYNKEFYSKLYYKQVIVEGKSYCFQDAPVYYRDGAYHLDVSTDNVKVYANRPARTPQPPPYPTTYPPYQGGTAYRYQSPKDKLKEALESA